MIILKIVAYLLIAAIIGSFAGVIISALTKGKKSPKNSIIRRHYTDKI